MYSYIDLVEMLIKFIFVTEFEKAGFMHTTRHTFHYHKVVYMYTLTNNSGRYWC